MAEPLVSSVSDTARWVAVYRAQESARPDALFKDPLAAKLAGERGREIIEGLNRDVNRNTSWAIVARTRLIDDMVAASLREGVDRVVNLAAGLDTRPYRLALPASLEWIEADLPALLDEKERLLASEKPTCKLSRERVDLGNAAERGAFLDRALGGGKNALVLTEGLLIYLKEDAVLGLGQDLAKRGARFWIVDIASPGLVAMMQRRTGRDVQANAPMTFAPENGVAFFAPLGWKVREVESIFRNAARYKRLPRFMRLFAMFPDPPAERPGRRPWSAVVRYERA